MHGQPLWTVDWRHEDDLLQAIEPTDSEIVGAAPQLAAFYNNDHNRTMLAHADSLLPAEVVSYYAELRADGGRPFLLRNGRGLVGDADLRNVDGGAAEFAILIGDRGTQGRGVGTRYALMIHLFAFTALKLERIYVSIVPGNVPSRRLFEKLGYAHDDSAAARDYADEDTDVTMSIDRPRFEAVADDLLGNHRAEIRMSLR